MTVLALLASLWALVITIWAVRTNSKLKTLRNDVSVLADFAKSIIGGVQ